MIGRLVFVGALAVTFAGCAVDATGTESDKSEDTAGSQATLRINPDNPGPRPATPCARECTRRYASDIMICVNLADPGDDADKCSTDALARYGNCLTGCT